MIFGASSSAETSPLAGKSSPAFSVHCYSRIKINIGRAFYVRPFVFLAQLLSAFAVLPFFVVPLPCFPACRSGDASVGAGVFSPFCGGVFVFFRLLFLLLKHMNAAAAAPIAAAASTENTIIQTRFTLCALSF